MTNVAANSGGAPLQWWIVFTCPDAGGNNWLTGSGSNKCGKVVHTSGQPSHQGIYGIFGPYKDKATAEFALKNNLFKQENPVWKAGQFTTQNPSPVSGLSAIGNFFSSLSQAHTWLRVAEVGLGVILISVGIAKMTNALPIATKIASYVK